MMKIKQIYGLESQLMSIESNLQGLNETAVILEGRDVREVFEHHFVNFKSDTSTSVVDLGITLNDLSLPTNKNLFSSSKVNSDDYANRVIAQSEVLGIVLKTSTFTLQSSDKGKYIRYSSLNEGDCVIPNNSSVPFPINTEITLRQAGIGTLTLSPSSGVTLYGTVTCPGQNKGLRLVKFDTNSWDVWVL